MKNYYIVSGLVCKLSENAHHRSNVTSADWTPDLHILQSVGTERCLVTRHQRKVLACNNQTYFAAMWLRLCCSGWHSREPQWSLGRLCVVVGGAVVILAWFYL